MSLHPDRPNRSESPGRESTSADARRLLEQVTSPAAQLSIVSDSRDADSDTETTALRESWLALSQLLDSNTPDVNAATLLSKVRRRVGRQESNHRRWRGAGLALAASLLLAVGAVWLVSRSSRPSSPDHASPTVAKNSPTQVPFEPPQYVAIEPDSADSPDANFDAAYWQDDLADDLAQTQQELANIQANWYRRPDPMAWMQFQMNEFEHELGDSSL